MKTRKIAFDIIYDALEKNIRTDELLNKFSSHQHFPFINNLVESTVKNLLLLDHITATYTKQDLSKKLFFKCLFRLIFAELYILKTPPHAVFNEWVEIVKENNMFSNLAHVINAILHSTIKELPGLENLRILNDPLNENKISILYSLPTWIIDILKLDYSLEEIEKIARFFDSTPDTTLRINTINMPEDKIKKHIRLDKVEFEESKYFNDVIKVKKFPKPIKNILSFKEGKFYMQDEASIGFIKAIVPLIPDNAKILDATCGLGGKLGALYQYLNRSQSFLGWDPNGDKLILCRDNFRRLGFNDIKLKDITITKLPLPIKTQYKNYFDCIIVDPPCTNLGVLRRKPQAKFSQSLENQEKLVELQQKILNSAVDLLSEGGLIVFSVCTFAYDETYQNVKSFLNNNKDFSLLPIPPLKPEISELFIKEKCYYSPKFHILESDYLFGVVFKKKTIG